ncbi:hypothetical protein [Spirosoma oryzicola]|uniref:hypothetical protein n=1 Tax=Spirosoma oryzicola TaxID=2898794 RepID=UPI001E3A7FC8|nr:hypothetical protein [Spirosoma oryzicola]UHG90107.1 hypothetical protein LQ777_17865 [Spirosoma oryzicola]
MRIITLDGIDYELPEAWDEVNQERLPNLIELVYLTPESGQMHHALIQLALNIRPRVWKKLHKTHFSPDLPDSVRYANAEVLGQLVAWLSWMWLKPMNKPPFAQLQVDGHAWLLAEPDFMSMSYGELTDLYIHLQAFVEQLVPGEERLNYLVATACRPRPKRGYTLQPGWNGDHREEYNEFLVRERVKLAAKIDYRDRLAVMLYVAATIKNLMNRYALFESESTSTASDALPEAYSGQSFIKNAHLLAEKGIFGNLKQTQQANVHEVLLFLEEHRNDLLKQQADANKDSD